MATYQTITIPELISGTKWDGLQITLYSDTEQTLPIDLTGCTISLQLRQSAKASPQASWSTTDNTITITGADDNIITIVGRNMSLESGDYIGDIDVIFDNGDLRSWFRLKFKVIPSFTN